MWNRTLISQLSTTSFSSSPRVVAPPPPPPPPTIRNVDVLIVGAGQAGMAAAHRLLTLSKNRQGNNNNVIHVVEAHNHVGGRTRNFDLGNHSYDVASDDAIELGGTWLSPNHTAFLDLCRELNIELFNASFSDDEDPIRMHRKEPSRHMDEKEEDWPWWYWGPNYLEEIKLKAARDTISHSIAYNESTGIKGHRKFRFSKPHELKREMDITTRKELEAVGKIIDSTIAQMKDLTWNTDKPGANWKEIDRLSTGARLMPELSSAEGRNVLRNVIHNKNAQEPEQVGFLYNLLSFKGCNSVGPDSQYRVRGGTQALPLAIANELGPERLTLGDPVQSIELVPSLSAEGKPRSEQIKVQTQSGRVFMAKALVLTGSPPAILGIHFTPPLPALQSQLLQRMPMGTSMKFIAIYRNGPWWRSYGLTGDVLAADLPPEISLPVELSSDGSGESIEYVPFFGQCFDTSPYSQKFGALTCFVEGRQNLHFSGLSQEQQRDLMRKFLALTFEDLPCVQSQSLNGGNMKTGKELWEPDFFVSYNWADDPYSRGAYTSYFPPGVLSVPEWWQAYRNMEKLHNVFLAGADYHVGFGNGFIEGAVRSGQRAADLVRERLFAMESEG